MAPLTVWLDETAVAAGTDRAEPEGRGRPLHYTDMAITTVSLHRGIWLYPTVKPVTG
ncbi:hypothetical protein D8L93_06190 [Sodalis-like symbiont of Bactericera trigonica]|nr:hypothetical protein D8L93_06190 [Sodalis-like symbiont of Bactericera trigonica]